MDSDLELDIFSALEGLDPLELLADDPHLASIAQELVEEDFVDGGSVKQNKASRKEIQCPEIEDDSSGDSTCDVVVRYKGRGRGGGTFVCMACKGPAKGIRYLGALVCLSCRAFFVRSNKNETYKTFSCRNKNSEDAQLCQINSKSWKSCQQCRFRRCLLAGMTYPDQSKTKKGIIGTPTPGQRAKAHNMIKEQLRNNFNSRVWQNMLSNRGLNSSDMDFIQRFPKFELDFDLRIIPDLAKHDIVQFEKIMELFYERDLSFDLYMQKNYDDYEVFVAKEVFLGQTGHPWINVKPSDRLKLVTRNGPLLLEYFIASRIGKTHCNQKDVNNLMTIMMNDPDEKFSRRVRDIFKKVLYFP